MKKLYYFVAIATFALFSCQQDDDPVNNQKGKSFTFKASIEDGITRGTFNSSNGLDWTDGDKIGIYVNDVSWPTKHQPFTLSSGAGTTQGEFTWDYDDGNFTNTNANVAFFPWQGTGDDKNNVYNGILYFKLPNSYDGYQSGQMLTPLVAPVSHNGATYDPIRFKHAGAAVKVTVTNLPTYVNSIGMAVDGKQIYGDFHIDPANVGTDALTLDNSENTSNNTVWLNYTNESAGEFTFIFPVPELTKPKLSFEIHDKYGVIFWKKNLKAQTEDLARGDILVMPNLAITPYENLTTDAHWSVCGTINSWSDTSMQTDGVTCVAKGVSFSAGDQFKIRYDGSWDNNYGADSFGGVGNVTTGKFKGDNITIPTAGTYDIIFYTDSKDIRVVTSGECAYPNP